MPVSEQEKRSETPSKIAWLGVFGLPSLAITYISFSQRAMVQARSMGLPFHRSTLDLVFPIGLVIAGALCLWFIPSTRKRLVRSVFIYILCMLPCLTVLPPILSVFWPW